MTLLKCYLSHFANRLIRQIRYNEACVHVKLVRQHRRHLLSKQQIVDVYPQIIVDVPKISLNRIQLDYLSKSVDYEKKAEAYRQKAGAYIELDFNPLWSVFDKAGTSLRPIVSSMNMPKIGISKFSNKLIRPIFDKHAPSTTIIDGVDLIHRLEAYTTNGYLKPKTYLCTFDITNLYTMLPQEESLDILIEFILQHGYQKVQNIPIDIIRKLALIIIKENVFCL
ncbi:unnamed protein product [Rotaria socialis]|uniref:Reverse transcriptase domain-containing protein n=1 Tax=Rotaria socialis TaxID=392032 RepID=A0A817S291_9BILA|nr:unnamed protein product [Rotaria socialis]CAF3694803.1 unnamed protein product [Rotaria socialis]CAF4451317.1 unnamed protein product [Rotaria socialis]CAF4617748.1 unnamed protein product [Rotaria socialis]